MLCLLCLRLVLYMQYNLYTLNGQENLLRSWPVVKQRQMTMRFCCTSSKLLSSHCRRCALNGGHG